MQSQTQTKPSFYAGLYIFVWTKNDHEETECEPQTVIVEFLQQMLLFSHTILKT